MRLLTLTLFVQLCCAVSLFAQGGGTIYYDYQNESAATTSAPSDEDMTNTSEYLLTTSLGESGGVFSQLSDYNFSFVRYSRRGYDHRLGRVYVNGIDLSNPFAATTYWNPLTAINNARAKSTSSFGLSPVEGIVSLAGSTDLYSVAALEQQPINRVSLMSSDRRFSNGVRFMLNSGEMSGAMFGEKHVDKRGGIPGATSERASGVTSSATSGVTSSGRRKGWAYSLAGSRRSGRDAHIEGVFSDDWSIATSLSGQLAKDNWLSVSFLAASTERGAKGAATKEAFELRDDNLYNPFWGYQDGRVRSSRVRKESQPIVLTTWDLKASEKFKITTTTSYMFGRSSYSSLSWYNAANPLPDYYRYMPGFFADPAVKEIVAGGWRENVGSVTQIDWNELYYVNNNGAGDVPTSYVLSSDVEDISNLQLASVFSYVVDSQYELRGGIRVRQDRASRYKRLDDLLGGMPVADIDQYLVDDEYYGDLLHNNTLEPNRLVGVGERFGYHYTLSRGSYGGWALLNIGGRHNDGRLSGYVGLEAAQVYIQRTGHYEKELFAGGASFGKSKRLSLSEYTLKGGVQYIANPSNLFSGDVIYGDIAPPTDEIFISERYQNAFAAKPRPTNILGAQVEYRLSRPEYTLSLTAYATTLKGQNEVLHLYDDISAEYSNAIIKDMQRRYMGVELAASVDLTPRLRFNAAVSKSNNVYLCDPSVDIYSDKSSKPIVTSQVAYIKGYRLSGTPQTVAAGELRYSNRKMLSIALAVNWVDDNYISVNPLRRMKRVFDRITAPEILGELARQERFGAATTVNLFINKTFRVGGNFLSLSLSVNNLANTKNIVYSGYEQMRLAKSGVGAAESFAPFASKYYYAYGRTYYLTVNYRF